MNAIQAPPRRKNRRKLRKMTIRPVREILLELAFRLHATQVVGRIPDEVSRK